VIDHPSLQRLLSEAATADPAAAVDDDLLAAAVGLEAARCRLDAAQAHVLAELERRGTTARELGLHTGPWLAREAHLPVGAARERVRVAVKLATVLPGTDAALTDGRISWDHATVLARAANPRIAEDVAAIEDELVDAAAGTVFDVWRREVVGRAEELDQDGGHDPNRDLARNRLSASRTFDGSTHVSGLLTGEYGAVAAWVIDAHADRLFHRFKRDHKHHPEIAIPPRATLRALAFAEICRLAGTPGPTGPPPSVDPDLPHRPTPLSGRSARLPQTDWPARPSGPQARPDRPPTRAAGSTPEGRSAAPIDRTSRGHRRPATGSHVTHRRDAGPSSRPGLDPPGRSTACRTTAPARPTPTHPCRRLVAGGAERRTHRPPSVLTRAGHRPLRSTAPRTPSATLIDRHTHAMPTRGPTPNHGPHPDPA
jgi:hypothetical protein